MSGKEATTHRTTDWPWDVPHGLVGHRWGYPVGLAFAASLILIFIAQLATPTTVVITTLGLVPILAAVWLLSTPLAIAVTVLGIALIGVAALSQAGRIVYANSAVGDVLGVSPESMIGTALLDYIVPEDRPQFGPYIADITLRRAARFEVRAMRPDGDVRELEVSHTLI